MQHWHIYRKWNTRLFEEMYLAYLNGRATNNPAENWYKGEIGFFDFYIIPLAKKLNDCGVFGVSSDEYLNYALQNRKEWERSGQEVVAQMVEKLRRRQVENPSFSLDAVESDGVARAHQIMNDLKEIPTSGSTCKAPAPKQEAKHPAATNGAAKTVLVVADGAESTVYSA